MMRIAEHRSACTAPLDYPLTTDILLQFAKMPKAAVAQRRLSLMDLDNARPLSRTELQIAAVHVTSPEFVATNIIFWTRCLPDTLASSQPIFFLLPFLRSEEIFENKPVFDQIRRWCRLPHGPLPVNQLQYLLQYPSMCGRTMEEVDWVREWEENNPSEHIRRWPTTGLSSQWTAVSYVSAFQSAADKVIDAVMAETAVREKQSIGAWWSRRILWMPTGSSSERKRVEELPEIKANQDLSRPNKKTVAAVLAQDILLDWLRTTPRAQIRCSTKHEPGKKNRPLHAADDVSTIIASYASAGMEQHMNVFGMDARQTPLDLARWMKQHYLEPAGIWVSTDYSKFFSEHHWWEQAYINCIIAKRWLEYGLHPNRRSKAYCSLWTARAVSNRWVDQPKQRMHLHGLFSGQRDTARDNTLLHCIYSQMVIDLMQQNYMTPPLSTYYCGDDEDAKFTNPITAAAYVALHIAAGWKLQPIKQLVGYHHHEYLKNMLVGDHPPIQPLSSMIAVLVTGNWYTPAVTWKKGLMEVVGNQLWSLIQRGANAQWIETFSVTWLNRLYTVRVAGKNCKLEWFTHRPSKTKEKFWQLAGADDEPTPIDDSEPHGPLLLSHIPGADDLVTSIINTFPNTEPAALGLLKRSAVRDATKGMLVKQLQAADTEAAVEQLGKRKTVHKKLSVPKLTRDMKWLIEQFHNVDENRTTPTRKSVLARHGVPQQLYNAAGKIEWLLDNDQLELAGEMLAASDEPEKDASDPVFNFPNKFWTMLRQQR
jgi:hypothetical protein